MALRSPFEVTARSGMRRRWQLYALGDELNPRVVHSEMVNFRVCEFHSNLKRTER